MTQRTVNFIAEGEDMNRNMNWLVRGMVVTGVTAALVLCVQGCGKEEPQPAPKPPTSAAPATAPAAKPTTPAAPATSAPKPAEPNKPAAKPADANKVSVKDAAGAVLNEAAKGAASGAAAAAGNLIGGTTEKK
jgi:hypothetical protein